MEWTCMCGGRLGVCGKGRDLAKLLKKHPPPGLTSSNWNILVGQPCKRVSVLAK